MLEALNNPDAFESLNDDFVLAAEHDEEEPNTMTTRQPKRKQHKDYDSEEETDGDGEENSGQDDEGEDLDALLHDLKHNSEGNQRRERNELEQIFDARFEKASFPWSIFPTSFVNSLRSLPQALAEFDDDEIGELDGMAEQIKGEVDVKQLKYVQILPFVSFMADEGDALQAHVQRVHSLP